MREPPTAPRPKSLLRDAAVIAAFDLGESLRSRKVLVFMVLYVVGAIGATLIFTEVLQEVEIALAEQLLVARTSDPGSLTQAVMESPELLRVLSRLVRDEALARTLVAEPPIALLYHWVALAFGPIFAVLTSSDTIASEVSSGSIRFALARTDRAGWLLGKVVGQSLLLAVGLLLGAAGAWLTGFIQLGAFDGPATAWALVGYSGTAFVYVWAHLGLALGVSQLTRSVPWSRALGLLALVSVYGIHRFLERDWVVEAVPVLSGSLRQLFPVAHRLDLWRPGLEASAPALLLLVALGASYIALGYLRFARRDA
jgi:ABC-type transport system involved in multi-copper enzyme maturation permease subunit